MDKQAVRNKLLGQKLSEYFAKNPDKKSVVMQADIGEGKVYWRAVREDANVFKVTEVTTREETFAVVTESKKKALSEAGRMPAKNGARKTISDKSQATSKSAKAKPKAESQPKTGKSKPNKAVSYDRFMGSTRSGKPIKSAMHPAYKDVHFATPGSTSRDSALKIGFNSYSPEDHADASSAHERNSMLAHIAGDNVESSLHANAALAHDHAAGGAAPSRSRKTKDLENTARGMGWDLQPTQWADPAMAAAGPAHEGKIGNPLKPNDPFNQYRRWKNIGKKKSKVVEGKIGNPLKDEERWRRRLITQKFIKESGNTRSKKEAFLEAINSLSDADKLDVLVNEIGMKPKKAKQSLKNLEIVAQTLYPEPEQSPSDWPYDEITTGAINSPSAYSPRMTT